MKVEHIKKREHTKIASLTYENNVMVQADDNNDVLLEFGALAYNLRADEAAAIGDALVRHAALAKANSQEGR